MPTEPAMREREPDPHQQFLLATLERYERPVIRYALSVVHDLDQARDIAQDVFIKLSRNLTTLDRTRIAPWLFTVCKNRALDHLRKHQRLVPMETATIDQQTSSSPGPSEAIEEQELSQQLTRWMSELPEKQREAVRLKFESGLSYKEISEVLHTSIGNVGTLIHLGVTNLRERWLTLNA
ncbi:sigma-70 family RNA polymerase sigma factor [Phragmitibacter flavus]|uniref:Sigma-70 family RNA polymerase sigma factor n=1 Tax=Phragmitibacter flavus TaxID=2576071 RepID=A0A5R8KBF0_9BACT|nr:sigma-70 family RNA polymerase sigma factor [Phragmitibacter flavus]TLD69626.1 sigma-70 family RNA polymerase sigma factor [Phragmitibacter flavus]